MALPRSGGGTAAVCVAAANTAALRPLRQRRLWSASEPRANLQVRHAAERSGGERRVALEEADEKRHDAMRERFKEHTRTRTYAPGRTQDTSDADVLPASSVRSVSATTISKRSEAMPVASATICRTTVDEPWPMSCAPL